MPKSFNSVILDSRAKPLVTVLEEIRTYIMERWVNNRIGFQNVSDNEILPNIRRKIDRTSIFTDLWLVIKSRYMAVYNHVIYPVNGSNIWVKTPYSDVQPPKYRKMFGIPKKRRNLEQGEIDGTDRKMRRTSFIVKCNRCKKAGHNKLTCKVTLQSQGNATQGSRNATQQSQATQGYRNVTQSSQGKETHSTQGKRPTTQSAKSSHGKKT
ncbi:unnamed protein product [Lathyrus oleraceus]